MLMKCSVEQACFLCQVCVLEDIWQVDIQVIIKQITLQNYESRISIRKPECSLPATSCDSHGLRKKRKKRKKK